MKVRSYFRLIATVLFAALAIPTQLTAQDNSNHKPKHHQYKLYDFGTFGGPQSWPTYFDAAITAAGAASTSDTSAADPFNPNCFFDCFVTHAAFWRQGKVTDLGALPGNSGLNSSFANAMSNNGIVVGSSENGAVDPATGYPEVRAVIWQDGRIVDLGTFGGTGSAGQMVNNRGQVVGKALNTVPDPYSFGIWFGGTTQSRAFLWEDGVMRDLGTLGGPDAQAYWITDNGKIIGNSLTSYVADPVTGIPPIHPFLWDKGKMIDLGGFGGTMATPFDVNNKGQVVGLSYLPGNQSWKGFIWDDGVLTPVTLGGYGAYLGSLNEAGDAAGGAATPDDQEVHVILWSKGKLSDIGAVGQDTCAQAYGINGSQQIVGISVDSCANWPNGRGFLWENGGPIVDLNALVENQSDLHVRFGLYLTDSGQIYGYAVDSNGNGHTVVLVPDGDCNSTCEARIAASENAPPVAAVNKQNPKGPMLGGPALGRGVNPFSGSPFRATTDKQR